MPARIWFHAIIERDKLQVFIVLARVTDRDHSRLVDVHV